MGEDRPAAGVRHPFDDVAGLGSPVGNVVGRGRREKAGEGLVAAGDGADVDESVGYVGAADGHPRFGDGGDRLPLQRKVPADPLDHLPGAGQAGVEHPLAMPRHGGRCGVEEIAEHVDGDAADLGRDFHAAHEGDAGGLHARRGLGPAGDGVVVGEPEHRDPGPLRLPHEIAGAGAAVGRGRVGMEVDHG